MGKVKKILKLYNWLQSTTAWKPVLRKSKFDQNQTSSSWEKCWEICEKLRKCFETLQLVAQCHSMNKNQSLIKIRPVVPEKNAKKCRKFGNIASGCRMSQHKQKSKFNQDETSSSREKSQKLRKLWNFAPGCRMPQHEQKWIFDEDQTSTSWKKYKNVKKILKVYNWLQNATAWTKIKVSSR